MESKIRLQLDFSCQFYYCSSLNFHELHNNSRTDVVSMDILISWSHVSNQTPEFKKLSDQSCYVTSARDARRWSNLVNFFFAWMWSQDRCPKLSGTSVMSISWGCTCRRCIIWIRGRALALFSENSNLRTTSPEIFWSVKSCMTQKYWDFFARGSNQDW